MDRSFYRAIHEPQFLSFLTRAPRVALLCSDRGCIGDRRGALEKQVNLRVIPTSAAIAESVELAHEFESCCFGRSGANSQGLGCPLAASCPDAIPQGRSSDFARAIARLLPRSSPCVRDSRRPDRGRSCRG